MILPQEITRDASGRPTTKTINGAGTHSETTYTYDSTKLPLTVSYKDLNEPSGANETLTSITYDATFKRPTTVTEEKFGVYKFIKSFEYDDLGRIITETKTAEAGGKTSTVVNKNEYQNGYLYRILDINNKVLWQVNTVSAKGQLLESITGNGIKMTNTYDTDGYLSKIQHDKTTTPTGNILTLTTKFDKNTDNLDQRINSIFGNYTEDFDYDELGRLKEFTNKYGVTETQTYDASGKITSNNLGTYGYDSSKKYQNTSITLNPEATGYYANREGIYNDSMESRTGWGTEKHPNTNFFSYDDTKAPHKAGKNTLKLSNTTTTEQYVFSDKWIAIDNAVPTEYTYSAWVYSDGPETQLFLFMEDGLNTVTHDNVVSNVTGAWTQITKTFLVPAGVKRIRLRLDNNAQGNVWFDDVQIRKTANSPTAERKLNITYNAFKSPIQIEETGVDKISFTYNDDNQRSTMYYGGLEDKELRPLRKYYAADGSMEVKQNMATGAIEFVTYIGGDGYSAPIAVKSDGINPAEYLYLHRDYQGTILAITDDKGSVVEKRLFDAWGEIIKVQDGAGNILSGLTVLDRGYTGHEHLQSVGLINMNARLYDSLLHRFLQVDNYIQDPSNTQNYNQYGYVLNNPLLYSDPSGNFSNCDICPNNNIKSNEEGPSNTQQQVGGNIISSIANFFKDGRNAAWFRRNAGEAGQVVGKNVQNAARYVGRNIESGIRDLGKFLGFGGGDGPPPNLSSYVNLGNSQTNNNLATAASLLGGASGAMNELSIVKFINAAPTGSFGVNYNGAATYWSNAFKGGTRGQISSSFVQSAKSASNSIKFASKLGGIASYTGSYVGYYAAAENFVKGNYSQSAIEGAANYTGIRIAATRGNLAGIGWTIGWNILGPALIKTELYNRILYGRNSAIYQDRERENGWYESILLKD